MKKFRNIGMALSALLICICIAGDITPAHFTGKDFLTVGSTYAYAATTESAETKTTESETTAETEAPKTLKKPVQAAISRLSTGKNKLSWSKVAGADAYVIYRSTKKSSGYKRLAMTTKRTYSDGSGKAFTRYYYKIRGVYKNAKGKYVYGPLSNTRTAKLRKVAKKVAYAGDSIMKGMQEYGVIKNTKAHRVYAKVGIQTSNFYNSNYMDSLLNYNPDRLYIMLGMNCLSRKVESGYYNYIIKYYRYILEDCFDQNPNLEVIIVAVPPVCKGCSVSMTCVNYFNKHLKAMVVKNFANKDIHWRTLTDVLADSNGYLNSSYDDGDGIHWKLSTCKKVKTAFDKMATAY